MAGERETLHEILAELRELRIQVTANDTALAALQSETTQLVTDVTALIAAIGNESDDISAGVNAVTADLATLDSQVTAATPSSDATTAAPADEGPTSAPPAPS